MVVLLFQTGWHVALPIRASETMKLFLKHRAIRIILPYVLFGSLWIAASDRVLEIFAPDIHALTILQTYKGWFFVAASSALLLLVLRREFQIRNRAEAALSESEEKYRLLMHNANDGIVLADAESGLILNVNRKIEELANVPEDQLVGRHISTLHPAADSGRCQRLFREVVEKHSSLSNDLCILHHNGDDRNIPVEVNANLIEINGKKIIQGIFRDIAQRTAAEEARRREKERAERYLDVAGVILRVLDPAGTVTLINRKGSEILGYGEEEIIGKNWFDHFVPDRHEK